MQQSFGRNWKVLAVLLFIATAAVVVSSPRPVATTNEKAFYADPKLADFVRPGLVTKIQRVDVAADGMVRVRVRITDPSGRPLDREGISTPGAVSLSFIAAYIPQGKTQYVAYTTRSQTSPLTNQTAVQASSDSGGSFEPVGEGEYAYTLRTRLPAGFDSNATHAIGVYSSRNLSEFDLGTQYDDDVFTFVPSGAAVTQVRDVVRTASCNQCHDPISAHGGARRSVEVCVLCHTPQTVDPDTGNTQDFPVLIHRIHRGSQLPSVQAGKPYQVIGFQQAVVDFSTIRYPRDIRDCTSCHEQPNLSGSTGAAGQGAAWLNPSRAACGSCHDDVNFATGEGHADLPQVSENQCATCHQVQGELEFDVSVLGAHTIPAFSRELPGTSFEITGVSDMAAGKRPVVRFRITDRKGGPILPAQMNSLSLYVAGPTTDYSRLIREDARKAEGSNGEYSWTFQQALPADATGTFAVSIEGYRNVKLLEGTTKEITQRDAGLNQTIYVPLGSGPAEARRRIVATEKCNACHGRLATHGEQRFTVEQCVFCHNPTATDAARRPASEKPDQTVDFRYLIHRIHTGEEQPREYTVYGFGGTQYDFTEVRYPGDRRNCNACHVNNSQQVDGKEGLQPVVNPRGLLDPTGPITAACTSCHTSTAAHSHALANTTRLGESCAACHGVTAEFSVDRSHAR